MCLHTMIYDITDDDDDDAHVVDDDDDDDDDDALLLPIFLSPFSPPLSQWLIRL